MRSYALTAYEKFPCAATEPFLRICQKADDYASSPRQPDIRAARRIA